MLCAAPRRSACLLRRTFVVNRGTNSEKEASRLARGTFYAPPFASSSAAELARGSSALPPRRNSSHTQPIPRSSMSYQWLTATVNPSCSTKCHQPAGRYSVSPARTEMLIGCAPGGRAPRTLGFATDDQRTGGTDGSEGTSSSADVPGERWYVACG